MELYEVGIDKFVGTSGWSGSVLVYMATEAVKKDTYSSIVHSLAITIIIQQNQYVIIFQAVGHHCPPTPRSRSQSVI